LDKFIAKYVLCSKCTYPEMILNVNGKDIKGKCDSCGAETNILSNDRMAQYIIKNPPQTKSIKVNDKSAIVKNVESVQKKSKD